MIRMRLLLTSITVALLACSYTANAQCPAPGTTVNGNKSISANVLGSTLTISTSDAYKGAITSITWRGKQFIDAADPGRELQTSVFPQPAADVNEADWVECYNPEEADQWSKLRSISAVGNVLTARTQLGFYLAPWEYGECGGHNDPSTGLGHAHNQCTLSNYILEKTVTIGFAGIENVIEYVAKVTIPEELARGEIVIAAYGPRNLGCDKTYDFRAGRFMGSDDVYYCPDTKYLATGSSSYPVAMIEGYTGLGMAMYSPELMQPMPDASHPIVNPFLQWVMFPGATPTSVFWGRFVQSTPYHTGEVATRRVYLVLGNLEEMRSALQQLHSYFNKFDPDVFDWQQYLAWYSDIAAAMPGQYNAENHWDWWGAAEGRRGAMPFWAPSYLQRYPDISNYCGPTNYPCAIWHYVAYGRNEGRIGN
jgi:hypothetical protein